MKHRGGNNRHCLQAGEETDDVGRRNKGQNMSPDEDVFMWRNSAAIVLAESELMMIYD